MRRKLTDYHPLTRLVSVALAAALVLGAPTAALAGDRIDGVPRTQLGLSKDAVPSVEMRAGELITEDGRVLWARNADDGRAMASLTKIMTAVVAMEHSTPTEPVVVSPQAVTVGESTSFIRAGERLPMDELLEALLVKSGNDAAVAIAIHVAGSEGKFVQMMNDKAAELGLKHTHFENPHGLDAKGHYTSAADLGTLARYAMSKPLFASIVRRPTARIHHRGNTMTIHSTNLLLGNYDGADGVKTGFTNNAGHSVVATAMRGGIRLYAVVLGTNSERQRFADARELLDWGFAHYRPQHVASVGTAVDEAVVSDYLDVVVPAAFSRDDTVAVFDVAGPIKRSTRTSAMRAPIKKGQVVGVATFSQKGHIISTVPLVATTSVKRPGVFERVWIATVRVWRRMKGERVTAIDATPGKGAVSYGGLALPPA